MIIKLQSKPKGLRRGTNGISSSMKIERPKIHEELLFQSEFEGSKISMSYFKKLNRKIFTEFLAVPSFFFFFLFKPTTDWMKSTHIREGNLHFNLQIEVLISPNIPSPARKKIFHGNGNKKKSAISILISDNDYKTKSLIKAKEGSYIIKMVLMVSQVMQQ